MSWRYVIEFIIRVGLISALLSFIYIPKEIDAVTIVGVAIICNTILDFFLIVFAKRNIS